MPRLLPEEVEKVRKSFQKARAEPMQIQRALLKESKKQTERMEMINRNLRVLIGIANRK